jgi:anti-sigma28 factor (negative regulator of flagellin synthesis)
MKGNNSNLSALALSVAAGSEQTGRTAHVQTASLPNQPAAGGEASINDNHLSELVRCLRFLAAASPERQARIEQIARSYASGTYQVDSHATASKIIDDALRH